ncbi:cytochrome P450 [Pisolithus orientalis]|uniref:cytochrome P450 n=1 Tax=Pisolithus orientalis TaxID=936130 RepID=UPI00222565E4|nr:cytochrome P450 [Pisolithus orientalis]KAI6004482.1 cytochrome P450 [Pisolithus orientalis]
MQAVTLAAFFLLITYLVFAIKRWRNKSLRNGLPLPPGPRGLPLVGNVLDIDISAPWTTYQRWGKRYGGVLYGTLLGQELVIINDEEIAHQLIVKRSPIYSDRPYINELLDFSTGLLPYGSEWRLHRKMLNEVFNKQTSKKYEAVQMEKVHQLLVNLLSAPLDYHKHFTTLSAAIIMAITYGYDVASTDDPFVANMEHLLELATIELAPERATLYKAMPFLANILPWLPGGQFKQQAAEFRALVRRVLDDPVKYVQDEMAAGTATTSFVGDLFAMEVGKDLASSKDEFIKAVAATVFIGGAETTSSTLLIFLLAMVLNPEAQANAQEEIDRVVGDTRLPDFRDRENLPYVEAVLIETLRWHPSLPLMLPHTTTTADIFDGMYIPKGVTVLINLWAMTQNELRYPHPAAFNPERHLTASGTLAEGTAPPNFGLGRRVCPGRYVADQSLWVAIVSILATLRIGKARDEAGHEVDVIPEFAGGLSSHPKPFRCSVEARSSRAAELIYASVGTN